MMTKRSGWLSYGLLLALSLGPLSGCRRSAEHRRREAEQAMVEASLKAAQAEEEAATKVEAAERRAEQKMAAFLAAVSREKSGTIYALHGEIDKIDRRLGQLKVESKPDGETTFDDKSADGAEIKRLLGRREALEVDLAAIGRVTPHDWPTLKARIERDFMNPQAAPGTDRPYGT